MFTVQVGYIPVAEVPTLNGVVDAFLPPPLVRLEPA